jgi:hypothetical protein
MEVQHQHKQGGIKDPKQLPQQQQQEQHHQAPRVTKTFQRPKANRFEKWEEFSKLKTVRDETLPNWVS